MAKITATDIENNKEKIISLLSSTKREGMDNLIDWLKRSDFFTAPSSVEYHNNCVGGLAAHSLNVYYALKKIIENLIPLSDAYKTHFQNVTPDNLIIIGLLHDVCKINYYEQQEKYFKDYNITGDNNWHKYLSWSINDKFPMGHGEKSVFLIQNFIKLEGEEALAIRWHMGQFDSGTIISPYQKYPFIKATNDFPLCIVLNMADTFASYCMEEIYDQKRDNMIA